MPVQFSSEDIIVDSTELIHNKESSVEVETKNPRFILIKNTPPTVQIYAHLDVYYHFARSKWTIGLIHANRSCNIRYVYGNGSFYIENHPLSSGNYIAVNRGDDEELPFVNCQAIYRIPASRVQRRYVDFNYTRVPRHFYIIPKSQNYPLENMIFDEVVQGWLVAMEHKTDSSPEIVHVLASYSYTQKYKIDFNEAREFNITFIKGGKTCFDDFPRRIPLTVFQNFNLYNSQSIIWRPKNGDVPLLISIPKTIVVDWLTWEKDMLSNYSDIPRYSNETKIPVLEKWRSDKSVGLARKQNEIDFIDTNLMEKSTNQSEFGGTNMEKDDNDQNSRNQSPVNDRTFQENENKSNAYAISKIKLINNEFKKLNEEFSHLIPKHDKECKLIILNRKWNEK